MTKYAPWTEDDFQEVRIALEDGLELERWAIDEMFVEIRRLREENEQLKEELDSHEAWKAVSEMAQRESEHLRKQQQKLIEVLEWIRDAGTDYQSINKAREALKVIEHE